MRAVKILLVEDSPLDATAFRQLLQSNVERAHHTVTTVTTIAQALAHLALHPVDLMVLDLTLPDADGLAGLVQVNAAAPDVPVVVHAPLADHGMIINAMQQGAFDYLIKDQFDAARFTDVLLSVREHQWTRRGLDRQDQHLRTLIENSQDGVVVIDPDGTILFYNRLAETLLVTAHRALLGTSLGFHVAEGETRDQEIRREDGTVAMVRVCCDPIAWERQRAYLITLRDVTSLKQLQGQLAATREKAKAYAQLRMSLLDRVSYTLRTSISTIDGFSDTLMQEVASETHREFAAIIKQEGQRISEMLGALLQLSQLDNGTMDVAYSTVAVDGVIQRVLAQLEPVARQKALPLVFASAAPEARIKADALLLERIIQHLVSNAIQFTDRGQVFVEVAAYAETVAIRVQDTGNGIDPVKLRHLFDLFGHEHVDRDDARERSCLGLTITKELVTLMGGNIDVETRIGKGSTLTVSFPRVPVRYQDGAGKPMRVPAHSQRLQPGVSSTNFL